MTRKKQARLYGWYTVLFFVPSLVFAFLYSVNNFKAALALGIACMGGCLFNYFRLAILTLSKE